eukprot:2543651-Pleurochrysis_carterae.AAC.1
MDIWVPRTHTILNKAFDEFGWAAETVGIYGRENGCGPGCYSTAMNSGVFETAVQWTSVGPSTGAPAEPWFMRDEPFSEPNGDYTASCWLVYAHLSQMTPSCMSGSNLK